MVGKIIILALLSAPSALTAVPPVDGSRWKAADPSFHVQTCSGGRVAGAEFSLPGRKTADVSDGGGGGGGGNWATGCSDGHARAERRYGNDYATGRHQFGGRLTVHALGRGDRRVSLKQTCTVGGGGGSGHPFFVLSVRRNGDLYVARDGGAARRITAGEAGVAARGRPVTVNTVHDAGVGIFWVYVDGRPVYTASAPGGEFYDTIGAATEESGPGAVEVTWSNIGFWTD